MFCWRLASSRLTVLSLRWVLWSRFFFLPLGARGSSQSSASISRLSSANRAMLALPRTGTQMLLLSRIAGTFFQCSILRAGAC